MDFDTPDDRLDEPELRTADDPDELLDDDLRTDEDLEDRLPAASRSTDDAALVAPRSSALPNELDPDRAGSRLSRVADREGADTGRRFSVLIPDLSWLENPRFCRFSLASVDSIVLPDERSVVLTVRLVLSRFATSPLRMIALLPLPLIMLDRTSDRTLDRDDG